MDDDEADAERVAQEIEAFGLVLFRDRITAVKGFFWGGGDDKPELGMVLGVDFLIIPFRSTFPLGTNPAEFLDAGEEVFGRNGITKDFDQWRRDRHFTELSEEIDGLTRLWNKPNINLLGFARWKFKANFDRLTEGREHSFQVLFGELIVAVFGHGDDRIDRLIF